MHGVIASEAKQSHSAGDDSRSRLLRGACPWACRRQDPRARNDGKLETPMPDAFVYDHVRTPRGRGKQDGALHEVTALALATVPLKALKEGNNLAEDVVDDVGLGW